jgi:Peptidase inhibitor I78 family
MKTPLIVGLGLFAMAACAPMPTEPEIIDAGGDAQQCKASQYQSWIGRNRSELPTKPANETWRVTCTTCPVTMDYNPGRLNILFDERTGVIREVKCG